MQGSRRVWMVGLSLLLVGLAYPVGAAKPTLAQSATARLAVAAFRNGQWDIYSLDESGQNLKQLTDDVYEDKDPAYSPDGSRLAYASRRQANWDVYVLDLKTGSETRLTHNPHYDGAPSWSPDGRRLAFESFQTGDLDVWVVDLETGGLDDVTQDSSSGDFAPAWSPDGGRIAFTSWRNGNKDLFLLDVASGDVTQVSDSPAAEEWPAWSPDGGQLAYVYNWLGEREVYVLDLSRPGASARQVTWLGRDDGPVWSPDGTRLGFINHRYDGEQLLWKNLADDVSLPAGVTEVAWLDGRVGWHPGPADYGTGVVSLLNDGPSPLYTEELAPSQSTEGEPWDLLQLEDVNLPTPDMTP